MLTDAVAIPIRTDADIVSARQAGRRLGIELGFSPTELTRLATAIAELTRNIVSFAGTGEISLERTDADGRHGVTIVVRDDGPGIQDVEQAMCDGFSTGSGLGLGLPGTRRLMDEFEITSSPAEGTTVRATTWTQA
jgi:serine/threonine-protein kinase RsbT